MTRVKMLPMREVVPQLRVNRGMLLMHFCSPLHSSCEFLRSALDLVASRFEGRVQFAEVEPLRDLEIAQDFGIEQIPTLILFVNDREVERIEHVMLPEELVEFLETSTSFYASALGAQDVY